MNDVDPGVRRQPDCPVCGGRPRPLLELPDQPIYQHPVAPAVGVPEPHVIDLTWVACEDCAHAWQPEFDSGLLERIYRSHYYTPAPDGIAVQFRDDFLTTIEGFGLLGRRQALLEIGASNGDVLAEIKARTGAATACAFEPDSENAAVARLRGLDVREQFFGAAAAGEGLPAADLIYSRHVIEHVFDFSDFFAGLDAIAATNADLVFETPSLDHHAVNCSFIPFHIEHVNVFSLRSLTALAATCGWRLSRHRVTVDGNLVAAFRRSQEVGDAGAVIDVQRPALDRLQESSTTHRNLMRELLCDRRLIFWGAGSTGVTLARMIGREPDYWTDGNPQKVGKRFIGFDLRIASPEDAFARAASENGDEPLLVIASSFAREILPQVRQLGWRGEIIDLAGNVL